MNEPHLTVRLDRSGDVYQPGDLLRGQCRIEQVRPLDWDALELSILWYTEGKGDEDFAVHHFQRWSPAEGQPLDLTRPLTFQSWLPHSPLSYDGIMLKIRWCVRVRLFLSQGKPLFCEEPFELGEVPAVAIEPAQEAVPAPRRS